MVRARQEPNHLGARLRQAPRLPDKGESLNKTRRAMRGCCDAACIVAHGASRSGTTPEARRSDRPHRRAQAPPSKGFKTPNLWRLRVEALDRPLSGEDWARVLYHLCKHRGFSLVQQGRTGQRRKRIRRKWWQRRQGLSQNGEMKDRTIAPLPRCWRNGVGEFDAQRNKQRH